MNRPVVSILLTTGLVMQTCQQSCVSKELLQNIKQLCGAISDLPSHVILSSINLKPSGHVQFPHRGLQIVGSDTLAHSALIT